MDKFPEKIEGGKRLERFLRRLAYVLDFIKDLAELRKPLQQKVKKEVRWTWSPNNSKIV